MGKDVPQSHISTPCNLLPVVSTKHGPAVCEQEAIHHLTLERLPWAALVGHARNRPYTQILWTLNKKHAEQTFLELSQYKLGGSIASAFEASRQNGWNAQSSFSVDKTSTNNKVIKNETCLLSLLGCSLGLFDSLTACWRNDVRFVHQGGYRRPHSAWRHQGFPQICQRL